MSEEALDQKITEKTDPLHNKIIRLETQLRQAQQALENVKRDSYNAGVEAAAELIENNEQWFEGTDDHNKIAEEIRDLKE